MSTAATTTAMSPSHALPLESFNLSILPKTTHNIAWSPDNELAIGCDDCVLVYVPDFSLRPAAASAANGAAARTRYDGPRQYDEAALRFPVAPLKSPELNRHLFEAVGHDFAGYTFFTGAGGNVITGHGSTLNHTVALAWSPGCLGRMNRAVLAVLTAAGILTVYCQGAAADAGATNPNARTMRPWIAAWHVGGGFLVPAAQGRDVIEKKECVTALAWAGDTRVKAAVLAYLNSDRELVVLLMSATHDANAEPGHPGTWKVLEVARFTAEGPHPAPTDPTDPDYVHSSSSFALSWGPWLKRGSSQTSILSYVAHNYIGFRQVTIDEAGSQDGLPSIHVGRADASGVCLHLSTDAFVVWEDQIWTLPGSNVCRGVIASPTKVQAFELPFDHTSPVTKHTTEQCETVYPAEEDLIHMENPITGLIIHPPSNSQKTPTPAYTLVRLSATHDNPAWHQTNLIMPPPSGEDGTETTSLDWATEITQIIEHQLPRALAHRQGPTGEKGRDEASFESDEDDLDSEMESDSDFDVDVDGDEDDDNAKAAFPGIRGVDTEDQIHLHRVRIWGLTASPGGATSAVLISLHSTIELERDTFAGLKCRVLFGSHPLRGHGYDSGNGDGGSERDALSTEARAWEWMYGGGSPVPGFSEPAAARGNRDDLAALRDHFLTIAQRQVCVFCEMPLVPWGTTSCCRNGHVFENCANTGVPIVAPNVSRTCGVCGMKCLKSEELLNMAPQLREIVKQDISAELCGGCGGKFMN
ncbi:hypothetical protein GGR51DRAFT_560530 [Nemania sp. FL0031]|nr:hypothetical protein GGR51DRAFT_560530 [Nemania sp. FL0031]